MFQKSAGYIYTQTGLGYKLDLDVVARTDTIQKTSLIHNKRDDSNTT